MIGDYPQDTSIYKRGSNTHWKPIFCVSREHMKLFLYLVIRRTFDGNWLIHSRSYADEIARKRIAVEIVLRQAKNANERSASDPRYSFTAMPSAHDATDQDVNQSGQFLALTDASIKPLQTGRTIFEYSARIIEKEADEKTGRRGDND